MAFERQYACDGCGDVVHGRLHGTFIHKDYLSMKSQMTVQQQDPQTRESRWTYLTAAPSEDLCFCLKPGMPCIERFIDRRRGEIEFKRRQKHEQELRDIRRQELLDGESDRIIHG